MPIPLMVRFGSGGHEGATVVGKVNRVYDGPGGYWGEGEFLDPSMVPEVPKAIYMLNNKVMGPSVDLDRDFTVETVKHPLRADKRAGLFREYNVIGVTLVPMPAFHQVHMSIDSDEDKVLVASVMPDLDMDDWEPFAVNGDAWKTWPLAPRDYKFDADDAVKRIAYWAGIGSKEPSIDRYSSAFLWRNGNQVGDSLAQDSFRLPLCDIVNGEPHLIYHAAYAAAALLSGAHGGLPNIPQEDKQAMIPVINEIYSALATAYNDPNLTSPFEEGRARAAQPGQQYSADGEEDCGCNDKRTEELEDLARNPFHGQVPTRDLVTMAGSEDYADMWNQALGSARPVVTTTTSGHTITVPSMGSTGNIVINFAAPLPPDVVKSIGEEKEPYNESGCHFNEDGACEKCGY
jgi:hypothetical protein